MTATDVPVRTVGIRNVIGSSVNDKGGRRLGQIEDVVRDRASNSILFAIVAIGAKLKNAERYQPIAWKALSYNGVEDAYVVNDI
jgi:sporulation protein YlmC with PRC-barrel domain